MQRNIFFFCRILTNVHINILNEDKEDLKNATQAIVKNNGLLVQRQKMNADLCLVNFPLWLPILVNSGEWVLFLVLAATILEYEQKRL